MLNVRRPVGRLLFWMLLMVMAVVSEPRVLGATPTTTTVSDVIYRADGTPAQGTLLISWPAFATKRGEPVAAGSKSVKIGAAGTVNISLVPNTGANPAGTHYTVVLKLAEAVASREIVDEDKFKDGLGKIVDGVVQCLNASAWAKAKA